MRHGGRPRPRGGAPDRHRTRIPEAVSTPPTRGCSRVARRRRHHLVVDPAHAGVLLGHDGCPWAGAVDPAHAGVLRGSGTPRRSGRGRPRPRGGAPVNPNDWRPAKESTPPTRGCSVHQPQPGAGHRVDPAHAGVLRTPASATTRTGSRPRPRGGAPVCPGPALTAEVSTPPTRGCSDVRPPARHSRGVDPRPRGGAPEHYARLMADEMSTPPTRGCSRGGPPVVVVVVVDPAHAGVLPRPSTPRARSRGRPRPRGGAGAGSGRRAIETRRPDLHLVN